jgi:hypothetical protein
MTSRSANLQLGPQHGAYEVTRGYLTPSSFSQSSEQARRLILAASTTSETRDRENGSWVVEASVDPPIVGEAMPDTAKPKLNKRLLKPPPGNHTPAENRPHLKQYYFKPGHKIRRPPGSNKITRLMKEAISAPRRPSRKEFLRRHAAGPD